MPAGVTGSPFRMSLLRMMFSGEETKCHTGTESRGREPSPEISFLSTLGSQLQVTASNSSEPSSNEDRLQCAEPCGTKGVSSAHMSPEREKGHGCHSKPALEVTPIKP